MAQDRSFFSFDAQAGRAAVLLLAGTLTLPEVVPYCEVLQARRDEIARCEADVLLMVDAHSPHVMDFADGPPAGVRTVYALADFFAGCGFDHRRPMVLVMDRNQRVTEIINQELPLGAIVDAVCAAIERQPRERECDVLLPAPVLLIPNIFDAVSCRQLIAAFEGGAHSPGGMASIDAAGNAIHRIDGDKKKREDYVVEPGSPISHAVLTALSGICLPEIKKAFQFEAAFTDRVLIARYDAAGGGYFKRHRDNMAPAVAFRQFAISINLNTGDYEGGHLLFPEYNNHRYRPAAGAGIVFSASLLHEAAPVTKGSRYVLLTFFHNVEAQARRLAA